MVYGWVFELLQRPFYKLKGEGYTPRRPLVYVSGCVLSYGIRAVTGSDYSPAAALLKEKDP